MVDSEGFLLPESTIESVYISNISGCTKGKVQIIKIPSKNRRRMTDGWMTFKYTSSVKGFTGIQECKKGNAATIKKLPLQLAQAIKYYWEICHDNSKIEKNFKVFCLTSEKYFAYVFKDDIIDLLKQLNILFMYDDCAPNELSNKPHLHKPIIEAIKDFKVPFIIKEMPNEVDLADILRDIYKHSL